MLLRLANIEVKEFKNSEKEDFFAFAPIKANVFSEEMPYKPKIYQPNKSNHAEKSYQSLVEFFPKNDSLGFYFLKDVVLRGRGFLLHNECLIDAPNLIPSYVRFGIDERHHRDAEPNENKLLTHLAHPVLVIAGDSYRIYGHWLVDILPRLWLFINYFKESSSDVKIILPSDVPDFAFEIMQLIFYLDRNRFIYYDPKCEEVFIKNAILPTLFHVDHAFHPATNLFVDHVLAEAEKSYPYKSRSWPDLIYVSRHAFREMTISYGRTILNESEVIDLVIKCGFSVVCPENLPWLEQVALFSHAKVIIGESGSGLHNSMFSKAGSVVLCLRPVNQVQATLAALRHQTVVFLCPENESQDDTGAVFHIDLNKLALYIKICKGLSEPFDSTSDLLEGEIKNMNNQLIPEHTGMYYIDWIANAVNRLGAKNYFEIGSRDGSSLRSINVPTIAIDPDFQLVKECVGKKPLCCFYQMTSDEFFIKHNPQAIYGSKIDFAFLDGLHLYEFLLRDFINTERSCAKNSVIVMHDCLPTEFWLTSRRQQPQMAWTGDVWKVVAILKKYRPDLKIHYLNCPPTGLVVCTNLNPSSTYISDNYFDIIEEFKEDTDDENKIKSFYESVKIANVSADPDLEELGKYFWL